MQLRFGDALMFVPSAMLRPDGDAQVVKLSDGVLKIRVRSRVTSDGGRSIMAGGVATVRLAMVGPVESAGNNCILLWYEVWVVVASCLFRAI